MGRRHMPGYLVVVGEQAVLTKGTREVVRKRKPGPSEDGGAAYKTRYNIEGRLFPGHKGTKRGPERGKMIE